MTDAQHAKLDSLYESALELYRDMQYHVETEEEQAIVDELEVVVDKLWKLWSEN